MIDIGKIYDLIFRTISKEDKLLTLLEIDKNSFQDNYAFLEQLRTQIEESLSPSDRLNDYSTRLCIHEGNGGVPVYLEEIGEVVIDINITSEKNSKDRRMFSIASCLIDMLDTKQRKKRGLPPLQIGLNGLTYIDRYQDTSNNATGWEKYSVVFKYSFLI